ncbi:MAG: signaling protein [Moraxellaceae bacterium]|jgi:signal transduction histidine kinase/CheY-like chemotaxis protein|nr:signaling protein [Moraxellaceae bacterium]
MKSVPPAPSSAPLPPRKARLKTCFFPLLRGLGLPFRFFRRTHFHRQLTLIVTVAILLLALFSALLNSWTASLRTQEYLVRQGLQITDGLARRSTLALLYHAPENAENEVDATLAFPDVRYVEILDASRRTLVARLKPATPGYAPPSWRHAVITGPDHATLAWENEEEWGFIAPAYAGREEASPFDLQERKPQLLGYVLVVVGKASMHELAASLRRVNMGLTLSFAVLLLGGLGLLVQRLIRPLNSLSLLMRRAEAGHSGLRAPLSGPRDITDMATAFNKMMTVLEEREAELQHSRDRALHTAQLKAQFAATVSHEVRTPLNGVVGMLDLLRDMPLEKPARECVDVAWNSAHSLMELINGILDFSKLEAGKLELEEINFDLHELVASVLELLARQATQRGLELGYQPEPGLPARVRGDSLRVRQVLINLMSNAVKFTEQGEVTVRLSFVATDQGRGRLRIEVIDTGIGMDDATVRHVFDSFAQADPSTTRKYGGTGLGLTISKHLVDLMRGEIGVSSEPGRGSTFWFTVPVEVVDAPAAAVAPVPEERLQAPVPGGRVCRVLVVEDNRINQMVAGAMLAKIGCHCEFADNGAAAVDAVRQDRFDLILMDCNMPEMDGYAATRHIRWMEQEERRTPTPIVAMTANAQSGDEELCRAAGMDDYLAKPVTLLKLREKVDTWRSGDWTAAPDERRE